MTAFYNEHDPFAAAWLRELIADGLIAPGVVDERSIEDVKPDDLSGFVQCHFFAGIGIWSLALRRAGWPDGRPIWTGSCPCQPFSAAGKGGGFDDERHLWPAFHWLIAQRRPPIVVGEQVASKDGLGWLDLVSADLEGTGYAFGAVDTCAAGFGAPHIRQRLYWVADAMRDGAGDASGRGVGAETAADGSDWHLSRQRLRAGVEGVLGGVAHTTGERRERGRSGEAGDEPGSVERPERLRDAGGMGDAGRITDERRSGPGEASGAPRPPESEAWQWERCGFSLGSDGASSRPGPTNGLWRAADWIFCTDGKWRPVEPGTFPLANGRSFRNRVAELRGAGNAIVVAQAQAFIEALAA